MSSEKSEIHLFVKYLFVLINALHLVIGILLVAFAAWLQFASPIREILVGNASYLGVISFLYAVGCALTTIGAVGALGNVFDHKVILGIFLGFSLVILILEIAVLSYGFTQKDSLQGSVQQVWTSLPVADKYLLQDRFNCCGFTDSSEWNGVYDASCLQPGNSNVTWTVGCYSSLVHYINDNVIILGIMVGGVMVASLGQVIFSTKLLWNKLRKSEVADENQPIKENKENRESPGGGETAMNDEGRKSKASYSAMDDF